MPSDDTMNIHERYKYLRLMQPQYCAARRAERNRLLDTMQALTHLDRKTLIRLMDSDLKRRPRRRSGRSLALPYPPHRSRPLYHILCRWFTRKPQQSPGDIVL